MILRLFYLIYDVLLILVIPLLIIRIIKKIFFNKSYSINLFTRLGFIKVKKDYTYIWVHAVSVGETKVAISVIDSLMETLPSNYAFIVTTATPTGYDVIKPKLGERIDHAFMPIDMFCVMNIFLKKVKPKCILIMETEIWPNLLRIANNKKIPTILVNGRLSEKSTKRYLYVKFFFSKVLNLFTKILAQGISDYDNYIKIGYTGPIECTGNIKFDAPIREDQRMKGLDIRNNKLRRSFVWSAGSTRKGEEQILYKVHKTVINECSDALLIIIPRHPERFKEAYSLGINSGLEVCYFSNIQSDFKESTQVIIADVMGKLPIFYASSDVAFVGGSLVGTGGQNIIEPVSLGIPSIIGFSYFNFKSIVEVFKANNIITQVNSADELSDAIIKLYVSEDERLKISKASKDIILFNKGALSKSLREVVNFI